MLTYLFWSYTLHRDMLLQRVTAVLKGIGDGSGAGGGAGEEQSLMEVLYVTATLFVHALYDYTHSIAKGTELTSLVL